MTSELITRALATATDTRVIIAGQGALSQTGQAFRQAFPGETRAVLVADENTWAAAAEVVQQSLQRLGIELEQPFIFPGTPTLYADYRHVVTLRQYLRGIDAAVVSIASGTLNDITKLACGELDRPYLNVCTAASMDGYAAFGASITRDGFKITRNCPAPAALVADLDLMGAAPARLTATGYGDLIEKVPAGADWLLADELGLEVIDEAIWQLVQAPLRGALAQPAECAAGEPRAIAALADGLLMSGLAMQAHQSSRPASGAGHNFSHQWEMEGHGLDWEPPLSHGNKVGIGTVAVCALYEKVLELDLADFDVDAAVAAWPDEKANDERVAALQPIAAIREAALEYSRAKYVAPDQIRERIELVLAHWPRIIERIRPQLVTAAEAAEMLRLVGAPYHPAMIDVDLDKLRTTYFQAQTIRNRYTILDALQELGLLGRVVDSLFQEGGYWTSASRP